MPQQHKRHKGGNQQPSEHVMRERQARAQVIECRESKDGRKAITIFDDLAKLQTVGPDVCACVLSVLVECAQPDLSEGALRVFNHCAEKSESLYSNTVRVLCLGDKLPEALQLLQDMKTTTNQKPRHRTFSPILHCACKLDNVTVVQDILTQMSAEYLNRANESDLTAVLQMAARLSSKPVGKMALDLVLADAEKVPDVELKAAIVAFLQSQGGAVQDHAARVPLESSVCSCCQQKLVSVDLPDSELQMLKDQTEKLVPTQVPNKFNQWKDFKAWISTRLAQTPQPNVIIDGANVAYFKGGFEAGVKHQGGGSKPKYEQVDAIYELLVAQGKTPIVFLHQRHFKSSGGGLSVGLEKKWKDANALYMVPHGHNDDVFWLYFTFCMGANGVLVSNDHMRDHRFEMMHSTRSFLRWKERHQAKFEVMSLIKGLDARVMFPSPHSIWVQRTPDEGFWHLPSEVPISAEREKKVAEINRLRSMGLTELKQMYNKNTISLDDFRLARQGEIGAEIPEYMNKEYAWTCVKMS